MPKTAAWQRSEGKNVPLTKTCISCAENKSVSDFYTNGFLVNGDRKYNGWCKVCRLEKTKVKYNAPNEWGMPSIRYTRSRTPRACLSYLLSKARQRNKAVLITLDFLEALWVDQAGLCALSGKPMSHRVGDTNIMSIDRIDSSMGYIDGNVQLVLKHINIAKHNLSTEDFYDICKDVYFYGL